MFTENAQFVIDKAKDHAHSHQEAQLVISAFFAALAASPEALLLWSNCIGRPSEEIKAACPAFSGETPFTGKMPLSEDVTKLIQQAKALATEIPDRRHPGLISLRHLVCAASTSEAMQRDLKISPIFEDEARRILSSWYQEERGFGELDRLNTTVQEMRNALLSRVFGQDHAVNSFVEGIFNAAVVGKTDPGRKTPKATFVFAGPPGVGKTFLAEQGASLLELPFKRFDMSSYSDHQSHNALVGFPKSYQAAHAGLLTEFVERNPTAILLFDEIEKAHLNVIQLFLQILDAGRLEDKFMEKDVTFRDTIIIFTTNAGRSLYDHENKTGVNKANSSFHRRTVLDALRMEKDPATGQQFFPQAICSRIAKGYPILFNYMGVNELQRVSRAEFKHFRSLFEQQYLKSVTMDDVIPLAMVLREGKGADARTIKAQTEQFLKSEIFKLAQLYESGHLEKALEDIQSIHFGVNPEDELPDDVRPLFKVDKTPEVLLVASESVHKLFTENITSCKWYTAENTESALRILATHDVDLVLLDLWVGSVKGVGGGTAFQFDSVPIGASTLREGQTFLRLTHERMPEIPIYLLSAGSGEDKVDDQLFLACVQAGGARGVIETDFTTVGVQSWEEKKAVLEQTILTTFENLHKEKKARQMADERKVLSFDTAPKLDKASGRVTIRLQNFRLARAVGGEDVDEILEDVERPTEKLDDVLGAEEAKKALQFIVDWLRDPKRYAALGVKLPKAILLTGPPGTGGSPWVV